MLSNNKIGIIVDNDFASKNIPPYPHPSFLSYESPLRIKAILDFLYKNQTFNDERVVKINPMHINEDILELAHSKYLINSVKNFSNRGMGLLEEEVFITEDTFELAKKAVGGAIQAIRSVVNDEVTQTIALIRPPGHHALREKASGLCVFNNIATSILYLRKKLQFEKKVAIIDIDCHFGDGIVQYFYDDPNVLYFSIHEYDFVEGDIGFIDELGEGEGIGKNINFPIPFNSIDNDFLECFDILEPILNEFLPDLIIIATGFDLYFADPIGNCLLTTEAYYQFTRKLLTIAEKICNGKLAFILEGGYSLIGLPVCIDSIIQALLKKKYKRPLFEYLDFSPRTKKREISKIKSTLSKLLSSYWRSMEQK
ncbi:MAG: histone deacetylase [Promethearchaeota archaeon]